MYTYQFLYIFFPLPEILIECLLYAKHSARCCKYSREQNSPCVCPHIALHLIRHNIFKSKPQIIILTVVLNLLHIFNCRIPFLCVSSVEIDFFKILLFNLVNACVWYQITCQLVYVEKQIFFLSLPLVQFPAGNFFELFLAFCFSGINIYNSQFMFLSLIFLTPILI